MKLNIEKDKEVEKKLPPKMKRFNTLEAVAEYLDEAKMQIFKTDAEDILLLGAKNTGKSIVPVIHQIYSLERDPHASAMSGRKYKESASTRLSTLIKKTLRELRDLGFQFPREYEKVKNKMYRVGLDKDKDSGQSIEFFSFEDLDSVAGADLTDGYFPNVHIEEPSVSQEGKTEREVTEEQWNAGISLIKGTVKRTITNYENRKLLHPPIPFKIWYTTNGWEPDHPLSKRAERVMPEKDYLKWMFGGKNAYAYFGNKELIDRDWEEIKVLLVKNHTLFVEDKANKFAFGRMSVFANPQTRQNEKAMEEAYANVYKAMVTNNSHDLAQYLGTFRYQTLGERTYNTDNIEKVVVNNNYFGELNGVGRHVLGISVGWDIDTSRQIVGTPVLITADIEYQMNDINTHEIVYSRPSLDIMPQVVITPFTKEQSMYATQIYMETIFKETKKMFEMYPMSRYGEFGKSIVMDDNQGAFKDGVGKLIREYVEKSGDNNLFGGVIIPEKMAKLGKGKDIEGRQNIWNNYLSAEIMTIHESNQQLLKMLIESVRKDDKKRVETGRFAKLTDFLNSAEAAVAVWDNLGPVLIREKQFWDDKDINEELN